MSYLSGKPLSSQSVLVLGGSGQMGTAVANEVVALGASVCLVGRDQSKLVAVATTLGRGTETLSFNASDIEEFRAALRQRAHTDHIVVAVSNGSSASGIVQTDPLAAEKAFSRLWTSYNALHLAPHFLPSSGSVTLISGSSARTPLRGYGVWTTLHGSIEALALAASIDIAPIRVNTISPGGIGMQPDRQLVHRAGQAADIGLAVAMVIANPAMTGAVIDVDSGERKGSWPTATNVR
jgi:NADP-dependent 3-hydroxy acid dehydrogenase YdfG